MANINGRRNALRYGDTKYQRDAIIVLMECKHWFFYLIFDIVCLDSILDPIHFD